MLQVVPMRWKMMGQMLVVVVVVCSSTGPGHLTTRGLHNRPVQAAGHMMRMGHQMLRLLLMMMQDIVAVAGGGRAAAYGRMVIRWPRSGHSLPWMMVVLVRMVAASLLLLCWWWWWRGRRRHLRM